MSIKRMLTKLATAFAAKKGTEVLRGMGGVSGVKAAMQKNASATSGGIGDIITNLGLGTPTTAGTAGAGPIGSVLGSLATAFDGPMSGSGSQNDLEREFSQTEPAEETDASPVLRAMLQMARTDGSIDENEQTALFDIYNYACSDEKAILTSALREYTYGKSNVSALSVASRAIDLRTYLEPQLVCDRQSRTSTSARKSDLNVKVRRSRQ